MFAIGNRVQYTRETIRRLADGHLMVGLQGTVQQVMDAPNIPGVRQFVNVQWDEPLLCTPSHVGGSDWWVVASALEVVR